MENIVAYYFMQPYLLIIITIFIHLLILNIFSMQWTAVLQG